MYSSGSPGLSDDLLSLGPSLPYGPNGCLTFFFRGTVVLGLVINVAYKIFLSGGTDGCLGWSRLLMIFL